jgi:hypothetical protein
MTRIAPGEREYQAVHRPSWVYDDPPPGVEDSGIFFGPPQTSKGRLAAALNEPAAAAV